MDFIKDKEEKVKRYLAKIVGDEEKCIETVHYLLDKNIICDKSIDDEYKNSVNSMQGSKPTIEILENETNKEMIQIIRKKDEEIKDLRNKIALKNRKNDAMKEQIKITLKKLEEKLYERRIEWMECINEKERERKKWEIAFKIKEREIIDIKNRKNDLIFLPGLDPYQFIKFLL